MANLLSIVNQQQAPIDKEKLKLFCTRQNVWEYFGFERDVFSMLSEEKQLKMVRKFYFDNISKPSNAFNIDSSIGSAIRNASGLTLRKVIESRDDRTEMTVDTLYSEEVKVEKSFNLWRILGILALNLEIFQSKKLTCPKILCFISIKAINLLKSLKRFIIPTFSY